MATVEILIKEGLTWVDYAPHVEWATASFTAKVNGSIGDCSFQILDRSRSFTFTFGQEINLKIDGIVRWGGYILRPQRTFAMPVVPHPLTAPRTWQIEGVDYNVIFDKRVLHDLAHPGRLWDYAPGTYDDTIINDIWAFFDMEGFTKDITRVATAVLDIPGVTSRSNGGKIASGGYTLRELFGAIARNTAAIYYCSPTKVITYCDSDAATSNYWFSDLASDWSAPGSFAVAYRQAKIREDSTSMVNDALVWGVGYGSQVPVFSRTQDIASQNEYGLWQAGQFTEGIYKQATADAVSSSMVNGSPAAHRGAKNPKRSVELVTFAPVFGAGDVVGIVNSSYAYEDMLPIRTMTITFPTQNKPRFAMLMSWEVDAAWSFYDPWIPLPSSVAKPPDIPPPCRGCGDPSPGKCDCGITDTFNRPDIFTGPGISDSGAPWTGNAGITDGNTLHVYAEAGGSRVSPVLSTTFPFPFFSTISALGGEWPNVTQTISVLVDGGTWVSVDWRESSADFGPYTDADLSYLAISVGGTVAASWMGSAPYTGIFPYPIEVDVNGTGIAVNVRGQAMSLNWADVSLSVTGVSGYLLSVDNSGDIGTQFDNLDIRDLNRCTESRFDNFNRTVAGGWGGPWIYEIEPGNEDSGNAGVFSVDGSAGIIDTTIATPAGDPFIVLPGDYSGKTVVLSLVVSADGMEPQFYLHGSGFFMGADIYFDAGTTYYSAYSGSDFTTASISANVGDTVLVKMLASGSTCSVKVWKADTPEPSAWGTEATGKTPTGAPNVAYFYLPNYPAGKLSVDYIDFDYVGKPCYQIPGCGSVVLMSDNFDSRTAGEKYSGDMLDPSPGGLSWTVQTSDPVSIIERSAGNMYLDMFCQSSYDLPTDRIIQAMFSVEVMQSDFDVSMDIWYGHPNGGIMGAFRMYAGPTSSISGYGDEGPYFYQYQAAVSWVPDMSFYGSSGSGIVVQVEGPGGVHAECFPMALGDFPSDQWGTLLWECKPSLFHSKLVLDLGGQTYASELTLPASESKVNRDLIFNVVYGTDNLGPGGPGWDFRLDNVVIGGQDCTQPIPVYPSGGSSGPIPTDAQGRTCGGLTPMSPPTSGVYLAGTHWGSNIAAYVSGTGKLTINGLLQTGNWTEVDPSAGTIAIDADIHPADVLRFCYFPNGAL
jgi:hypothetical protein